MARQLYMNPATGVQSALDPSDPAQAKIIQDGGFVPSGQASNTPTDFTTATGRGGPGSVPTPSTAPTPPPGRASATNMSPAVTGGGAGAPTFNATATPQPGFNVAQIQTPDIYGNLAAMGAKAPSTSVGAGAYPSIPKTPQELGAPSPTEVQTELKRLGTTAEDISTQKGKVFEQQQTAMGEARQELKTEQGLVELGRRTFEENQAALQNELKLQREVIASTKVDPNKFYENLGTWGRVGAAVSIGLNTIGSFIAGAPGRPNLAKQILDDAAHREYLTQKEKLSNLKEVYGLTSDQMKNNVVMQNLRESQYQSNVARINMDAGMRMQELATGLQKQDARQAALAFSSDLMKAANEAAWKQAQAQTTLLNMGIDIAGKKQQAALAGKQLEMDAYKTKVGIAEKQAELGLTTTRLKAEYGTAMGRLGIPPKDQDSAQKEASQIINHQKASKLVETGFNELKDLAGGVTGKLSTFLPNWAGGASGKIDALKSVIATSLGRASGGLTEGAVHRILDQLPNEGDSASVMDKKWEAIQMEMQGGVPATPILDQYPSARNYFEAGGVSTVPGQGLPGKKR